MDRFANNTLRTLAIIVIAIFVIVGSLVLALFALCMGALANASGSHNGQAIPWFVGSIVVLILLIAFGILAITRLAKGIVRDTPEYSTPSPAAPSPAHLPATLIPPTTVPLPSAAPPPQVAVPPPAPTPVEPHIAAPSVAFPSHPAVTFRLRPASRAAIRNLVIAIAVKALTEAVTGIPAVSAMLLYSHARPQAMPFGLFAWGVATIAPLLVLIYALLRHPGPRAFAYALVIPSIQIFFGLFGHSFGIFYMLRGPAHFLPLISLLPWFLDFLILYLAWKAVRLIGIVPNPTRLVVASIVMFIYTSLLPALMYVIAGYAAARR